jgi:hypothetical protein
MCVGMSRDGPVSVVTAANMQLMCSPSGPGGCLASACAPAPACTRLHPPAPACRPPQHLTRQTKVVYLFGDPLAAVASHYRRGHAHHQALKTSGGALKLDSAAFPPSFQAYVARCVCACVRMRAQAGRQVQRRGRWQSCHGRWHTTCQVQSRNRLARTCRGEDLFGLQVHLHNWLSTPTPYDVLFVR